MRRILIILGVLVLACAVFAVAVFGLAWVATNGAATAADAFMAAVQNGDMDSAYAMFSESLQDEVSGETFNGTFGGANLESWSFTSRSVENNLGSVNGTAVIDGQTFDVALSLINNDGWKINGYDFEPQG